MSSSKFDELVDNLVGQILEKKSVKTEVSTDEEGECPRCGQVHEEGECPEMKMSEAGIKDEDAGDFIVAASAAKKAGKKKFKFGGKEYPVTIKTDIKTEAADVDISKLSADQLAKLDKLMTSLAKGNLSDAEKEKAIKAAMADMGVMKEETELNEAFLETIAMIWFAGKVLPLIVGVSLLAIGGGLMGVAKVLDKIDAIKKAMKDKKVKAFIKKNMGKPIDAKMKAEIQKLFPPKVADKIRDELEAKGVIKETVNFKHVQELAKESCGSGHGKKKKYEELQDINDEFDAKVDGRRKSFRERIKALGYVKNK